MSKYCSFLMVLPILILAGSQVSAQNVVPAVKPKIVVEPVQIAEDNEDEDEEDEDEFDELIEEEMAASATVNGIGGGSAIPATDIYPVWDNSLVNPYNAGIFKDTTALSLDNFSFPLKTFYRVNSEFGQRRKRYHYGIDLKIERGDTVVSSFDGMVRIAKNINSRKGYGKFVVVRHYNGLETVYGHLDEVLVEPDQVVAAGEIIGLAGNTGRSTGPHLHYELRYQGRPINPRDVIDFNDSLTVKNDSLMLTSSHFVYPKKTTKAVASRTTTKSKGATGSAVWVIKPGDTLGRIAQRTGRSINKLCQLNGISTRTVLRIGQKIKY